MTADLARLDLRLRRRSMIGAAVGMAAYASLIAALYPTFEHDTSLDQLTAHGSTVAALFGATGSLRSVSGWLSSNLYANFVPLVSLLLTIGYGASAVAGQDEDGTLGLTATLPVPRRRLLLQKAVAMVALAATVPAATFLGLLPGPRFQLHPSWPVLTTTSIGVALLALDLGLLALLVGIVTGSRGLALGTASTLAVVSYVISSLAPVVHWLHELRFVSLFYWAVGQDQLVTGSTWKDALVLGGTGVVLLALALTAFDRLDIH